jgi:hypothetical protein
MQRLLSATLSLVFLVLAGSTVEAQGRRAREPKGFELMGGGGINICIEDGDANCERIDSSFVLLVAPGYRFSQLLGLYVDIAYGWFKPDESVADDLDYADNLDASMNTLTVMPTVRLFVPVSSLELYGGAGLGYSSISSSTTLRYGGDKFEGTSIWSNLLNLKLTAGFAVPINPKFHFGVNVDMVFNANDAGEGKICVTQEGDTDCDTYDGNEIGDVVDLFQATGFIRFRF